jgi:hypothetical protein
MFMYSERYSDVFRNPLKPASRRRRRGLFSSGVCLQNDNARCHTARHTVKQIQNLKLEVLPYPPYSPDLAPQRFSPLLAPKRRSPWTSLQIGWWGEAGGAWLASTAIKRLLLPMNLCLSGTLEAVCRTWWGLHWRLVSLYCIYFWNK